MGEILWEEFLKPMNISAYTSSVELCVSRSRRQRRGSEEEWNHNGRSASQYFETFEQFGLNLQEAFVAHQARPACKGIKAIKPLAAAARQPDSEG
jgi:plasmid maintenance system antidote protein VapI